MSFVMKYYSDLTINLWIVLVFVLSCMQYFLTSRWKWNYRKVWLACIEKLSRVYLFAREIFATALNTLKPNWSHVHKLDRTTLCRKPKKSIHNWFNSFFCRATPTITFLLLFNKMIMMVAGRNSFLKMPRLPFVFIWYFLI